MFRRKVSITLSITLLSTFLSVGTVFSQSNRGKLRTLLPGLFASPECLKQTPDGNNTASVAGSTGVLCVESRALLGGVTPHDPRHYQGNFQSLFTGLNASLGTQIASLVLPPPASAVTYSFDPVTGLDARSTQGFGPVLSERAETIGRGKFSFGFNWQRYSFDELDGVDLDNLPFAFFHVGSKPRGGTGGGGLDDIVTARTSLDITVNRFTSFFTYGLTERLDFSVAVPVVKTDLRARGTATLLRIGSGIDQVHFLPPTFGNKSSFEVADSATGIGDVVLRLKGSPFRGEVASVGLGVNVRLPTGDEDDFLGSGAAGVNPFGVVSFQAGRLSPNVVVGYQWNGNSKLAGDRFTDFTPGGDPIEIGSEEGDLPNQFFYQAGTDISLGQYFTVSLEYLGQRVIDARRFFVIQRTIDESLVASPATGKDKDLFGTTIGDMESRNESFNMNNAAVGFKVGTERFLLAFNVLFSLDDAGLRDRVTPFVGFELFF